MDEIVTRGRQEFAKRRDALAFYLGAASRAERLLPVPSPDRPRFFFTEAEVPVLAAEIGRRFPDEFKRKIQQAEQICRGEFNLLGYQGIPYGPKINWQADQVHRKISPRSPWYKIRYLDFDEVGDSKIVWELNRHQHFVTLAMAYRFTNDERFGREIFAQWLDWQRANPYPIGINWASSLEVAFRSLSWIWTAQLLSGTKVVPPNFRQDLSKALALHGRHIETYLSTYFSPNTHLLGEAVALFFLGTLCPEIPAASRWREQGWKIVCREAQRQVRRDGVYFEQSTYYHVYALDFLLHARILAAKNDVFIPPEFDQVLERMLDFLSGISQAGVVPRLGDDDGGRVFDPQRNRAAYLLDPLATGAVLFQRSDWTRAAEALCPETLWLLGLKATAEFEGLARAESVARPADFSDSGIYVLAEGAADCEQLVVDAGPQGEGNSGHGHADALQVHLSIAGEEWLVDPGTFSYVAGEDTRERLRATGAHNTLQVDGFSQAVPTGPFSWTHLPEVHVDAWIVGKRCAFFQGHHLGYSRLAQPVIHRRSVCSVGSGLWLIRDVAEGSGEHQLDLFWHLAPDAHLEEQARGGFCFRKPSGQGLVLLSEHSHRWSSAVISGAHSMAYGRQESAPVLRFSIHAELPCGLTTLIFRKDQKPASRGQLVKGGKDPNQEGYSCAYEDNDGTHQWAFSVGEIRWQLGELASDAKLLYCLLDKNGWLVRFIIFEGTFFKFNGKLLWESPQQISVYEWQAPSVDQPFRRDP
jgi:Heparinase II/III-like protein/Heparinase II/III N-terminus